MEVCVVFDLWACADKQDMLCCNASEPALRRELKDMEVKLFAATEQILALAEELAKSQTAREVSEFECATDLAQVWNERFEGLNRA